MSNIRDLKDRQLIKSIISGNSDSFDALFLYYKDRVYKLSIGILKNQEDAEESVNNTFLRVFRKLYTYKGNSEFATWLYRVAFNSAQMIYRDRKRFIMERLDTIVEPSYNDLNVSIVNISLKNLLDKEISKLPPLLKYTFIENVVNKRKLEDLANEAGVSKSAIKNRIMISKHILQEALEGRIC